MKSLRQIYRQKYMIRPTLYLMAFKALVVVVLTLLWSRFIDKGVRGVGFGFSTLGLILLCLSWFNYLSLDGVSIRHLMEGWQKKKEKKARAHDMIDFVDENVVSFQELEKEEKTSCRLVSSFVTGLLFVIVGIISSLF